MVHLFSIIFCPFIFWILIIHQAKTLADDQALALYDKNNRNLATPIISTVCNTSLYQVWEQQTYSGLLASDTSFWIYQTQPQIILTNSLALQLAVIYCTREFNLLYYYKAGKNGPITIQDSYKIMCNKYCLQSDILHQAAMRATGCNCLSLSTQSTDASYIAPGDWCNHNSARLLCNIVGYCGVWDCDLDDFMCPRYEWNKLKIPYKGPGTCIRGSAGSWKRVYSSYSGLGMVLLTTYFTNIYLLASSGR